MKKEDLLRVLNSLGEDEFQDFKWFLLQTESFSCHSAIPKGRLENAARRETVDQMVQNYTLPEAVQVTKMVLKKIKRNDLVQKLSGSSSAPAMHTSGVGSSSPTAAPSNRLTDGQTPVYSVHTSGVGSSSPIAAPSNRLTDGQTPVYSGTKCNMKTRDVSYNHPTTSGMKLLADDRDLKLDPLSPIPVGGGPSAASVLTSHLRALEPSSSHLRDSGVKLLSDEFKYLNNHPLNVRMKSLFDDPDLKLDPLSLSPMQRISPASDLTSRPFSPRLRGLVLGNSHLLSGLEDAERRMDSFWMDHGGEQRLGPGLKKWSSELRLDTNGGQTVHKMSRMSYNNTTVTTVNQSPSNFHHMFGVGSSLLHDF